MKKKNRIKKKFKNETKPPQLQLPAREAPIPPFPVGFGIWFGAAFLGDLGGSLDLGMGNGPHSRDTARVTLGTAGQGHHSPGDTPEGILGSLERPEPIALPGTGGSRGDFGVLSPKGTSGTAVPSQSAALGAHWSQ